MGRFTPGRFGSSGPAHSPIERTTHLLRRADAAGRMEVYRHTGIFTTMTPNEKDVCRFYRRRPLRMAGASLILGNLHLNYGRVLQDLSAGSAADPMGAE